MGGRLDVLNLPGQDSMTIPCPRTTGRGVKRLSHFLPHPLQGPDEGEREGLWMDILLMAVGNGFQMYPGMWNKPCDLGQTQAELPAIPHITSRCRYWPHGGIRAYWIAKR